MHNIHLATNIILPKLGPRSIIIVRDLVRFDYVNRISLNLYIFQIELFYDD